MAYYLLLQSMIHFRMALKLSNSKHYNILIKNIKMFHVEHFYVFLSNSSNHHPIVFLECDRKLFLKNIRVFKFSMSFGV